ncbi:chloride channel protein [Pigmentiphaga soli]|uniref:Chloride channel protein n=1 Tax=Pigmentiphaga soli TaxID=1007095 RepID=A0ABP8GU67_9BURK
MKPSSVPAPAPVAPPAQAPRLGDFTTDLSVLRLTAMAAVVGAAGIGAAWFLLRLIALCTNIAYYGRFTAAALPLPASPAPWTVLVPVAGCLLIGLMARYGSEKIRGHGIPEAMEAILIGQSRIQPKVALLKPVSSAVSIGTGGPFGAEGPIIMTGGAIGSLFAQLFHMTSAERKTLLVAGAAAGMTSVFGTPLAAVLLAVELLLFEWKPRSFLPVAVAAAVAAAGRTLLLDPAPLFPYHVAAALPYAGRAFAGDGLAAMLSGGAGGGFPAWAAIGILAGLGSGVLTAMVYGAEDLFQKLPLHWMWWPAVGGLAIGVGGLIEPAALGVGYDNIRHLLAGDLPASSIVSLLAVKSVIWAIALGSGTSGGVLAPLLIFGGALGALAGGLLPSADPGLWAALGMAAMMGGTMRAPLTATLFAVELTGELHLLLPAFTACAFAYGVTVLLLKRSILTEKIARRGHHVAREYHVDPFQLVRVDAVMTREVDTLPADATVGQAIGRFTTAGPHHTALPVVDETGVVVGMVTRADCLAWLGRPELHGAAVGDAVSGAPPLRAYPDELTGAVADRMAESGVGRLPVVDRATGRLAGIVGRKDLMRVRAQRLEEERIRRAFRPWDGVRRQAAGRP